MPIRSYNKLVPADSFIGRYLAYMQSQETALPYDWWCSLWCISAAVGRRIRVDRPRAPVFLNMYLILVGESGRTRKSASVTLAGGLVRKLTLDTDMGYIDAKVTSEALDELLHQRTMEYGSGQLCITIPELAVFLGTESYIANMPTLLTDLYDCPEHRHGGGTILRGECIQRSVYLSILSASTPIWLLKAVNPKVVEGGFTSRCLFVTATNPKRSIPWPEEPDATLLQDIEDDLRIIQAESQTRPNITLDSLALQHFRLWYAKRPRSLDLFKQSFEAREDAHVLRVAALLCINDGSWTISKQHINTAVTLVMEVKEQGGAIFHGAELKSKYSTALSSIRALLISAGMDPVPYGQMVQRCQGIGRHEFRGLLEALHELGAIQRFEVKQDGRGRPAEYIRGTELLLEQGLGDKIMEKFT